MENQDFTTGAQNYGTGSTLGSSETATAEKGKNEKLASQLGSQVNEKIDKVSSQVKDTTNRAMETTSKGIDKVAMYFREKDSEEMLQDLQQVVRKHPGKSLIAGLLFGVMVGRVIR